MGWKVDHTHAPCIEVYGTGETLSACIDEGRVIAEAFLGAEVVPLEHEPAELLSDHSVHSVATMNNRGPIRRRCTFSMLTLWGRAKDEWPID